MKLSVPSFSIIREPFFLIVIIIHQSSFIIPIKENLFAFVRPHEKTQLLTFGLKHSM